MRSHEEALLLVSSFLSLIAFLQLKYQPLDTIPYQYVTSRSCYLLWQLDKLGVMEGEEIFHQDTPSLLKGHEGQGLYQLKLVTCDMGLSLIHI